MSLNFNTMVKDVIDVTRVLVGNRLSKITKGDQQVASVFPNRERPPKPTFPYAIVDHIGAVPLSSSMKERSLDEDGNLYEEIEYEVRLLVQFSGSVSDDVLSLATELRTKLLSQYGLDYFTQTTGFNIKTISFPNGITFNLNSTDYEEHQRIVISFIAKDIIYDLTPDVITSAGVDGTLHQDINENEILTVSAFAEQN